ncbi:MAG: sulfotransferase [Cyclobacteriaceae bacterium]|nr:MAG: sulfotransferase [Cyclobacteriaceae bacterium]
MRSVFIGGYMHSGTSMLINILKRHPAIFAIRSELRLFENIPSIDAPHKNNPHLIRKFCERIRLSDDDTSVISAEKDHFFATTKTYGELVIRIIEKLATRQNNLIWAEKTPSNVFFIDKIFEKFPDSKVILIHRDVRNIIASKKVRTLGLKTGRYNSEKIHIKRLEKDWNILADSFSWQGTIKSENRALLKYSDKIVIVRYEDFVANPVLEWKRICEFLNIIFIEECLDIKFRNAAIRGDINAGGIVASSTDWRDILSQREAKLATTINRKKLRKLGYAVQEEYTSVFMLPFYFLMEIPGVFKRVFKRYRMFTFDYFLIYMKSMFRRF